MKTEWEIKLLLPETLDAEQILTAVRASGLEVQESTSAAQEDLYLDTARGDLSRTGVGLRVRERRGRQWVTWKDEGRRKGAAHTRTELTFEWKGKGLPRAARALPPEIRREVEPFTYGRGLREIARVENERAAHRLGDASSGATAELAIDRVVGHAGRRVGRFAEVEIEALEGDHRPWLALSRRLRDELGMTVSRKNKLKRVLDLAGAERLPRVERRPIVREMGFTEASFQIFRKHFERLKANEPGTRLAEDIEALHDMRVSSRRLRAAFRLVGGAFAPGGLERWTELMRETGQTLGHARDLDVFIDALPKLRSEIPEPMVEDLLPFEKLIVSHRRKEQGRILRWMQSPRRLRAFEEFEEFLEQGSGEAAPWGISVGQIAPGLVIGVARKVYRQGGKIKPSSPPERLHRLRITMKKMRYAMEDFSDLYGDDLGAYIKQCKKLQDVLGAFNDARVMTAWLGEFIRGRGGKLPRRTLLAVGALMGTLSARGDAARSRFKATWESFDSDENRERLNTALADRV